jgi:hypothetical protein
MTLGSRLLPDVVQHRSIAVDLALTSYMPCHPHQLTRSSAAMLGTVSARLREVPGQGATVRREGERGMCD